jgi:hypothetical protein
MASPIDSVEKAFFRCEILLKILDDTKRRTISDKANQFPYAFSLGIIEKGDTIDEAKLKIESIFSQLESLITHLTILDVAASFENIFRERLKNAIGEARKAVRKNYKIQTLFKVREELVQDVAAYSGLGGLETLLGPQLDQELLGKLKAIRANRNRFVHGTEIHALPTIDGADALKALREVAELL